MPNGMLAFASVCTKPPCPNRLDYTWVPPEGATKFHFGGKLPDNPDGPPPFKWTNVPQDGQGNGLVVMVGYEPPNPYPWDYKYVTDKFLADRSTDGWVYSMNQDAVYMDTKVTAPTTKAGASEPVTVQAATDGAATLGIAPAQEPGAAPQAGEYYLRHAGIYMYNWDHNQRLTQELCEDWMRLLTSDEAFFALRCPVYPPTLSATEPYTDPFVIRGEISPTLRLIRYGPNQTLVNVPLERRPERQTFLANAMPQVPGEHWIAFGVAHDAPIACPAGLNVPGELWEWALEFYLDLGGAQDGFVGRMLPMYACFEGAARPFFMGTIGQGSGNVQGQTWGITTIGPLVLRLEREYGTGYAMPIAVGGGYYAQVSAGRPVTLAHSVTNYATSAMTVTLSYSSTRSLPWGIYEDVTGTLPITRPVRLGSQYNTRSRNFWVIAAIPAGAVPGPDTLYVTATDVLSPTRSTWAASSVWVGDWVPPEPWRPYGLALPMIER